MGSFFSSTQKQTSRLDTAAPGAREQYLRNLLQDHIGTFRRIADSAAAFGGRFDPLINQLIEQGQNLTFGPDILKLATGEGAALSRSITGRNLRAFREAQNATLERAESLGRGSAALAGTRGSFAGPTQAALGQIAGIQGNLIAQSPTGLDVGLAISGDRRNRALANSGILQGLSAIRQQGFQQQLGALGAAEGARATGEASDQAFRLATGTQTTTTKGSPSPFDIFTQLALLLSMRDVQQLSGNTVKGIGNLFGGGGGGGAAAPGGSPLIGPYGLPPVL